MTRVLIGDALVNEDERLQARINQLHDRLEATLRQSLRIAASSGESENGDNSAATANLFMSFVTGRWHQFAKSGFKRSPTEFWADQWRMLAVMRHSKET
jgi:TetR/AcrR family transcriptional regulator